MNKFVQNMLKSYIKQADLDIAIFSLEKLLENQAEILEKLPQPARDKIVGVWEKWLEAVENFSGKK